MSDRQLEALLARLDAIQEELARINRRLELNEGVILLAGELRSLNESLGASPTQRSDRARRSAAAAPADG